MVLFFHYLRQLRRSLLVASPSQRRTQQAYVSILCSESETAAPEVGYQSYNQSFFNQYFIQTYGRRAIRILAVSIIVNYQKSWTKSGDSLGESF